MRLSRRFVLLAIGSAGVFTSAAVTLRHGLTRTGMRLNRRFVLLAVGSAGVFTGAAVTLGLGHYGTTKDEPLTGPRLAHTPPNPSALGFTPLDTTRTSRFTYMPFSEAPLFLQPPADDPLRGAEKPETWSTETRHEATVSAVATKLALAVPQRPRKKAASRRTRSRRYTLKQRLTQISPEARKRIANKFEAANVVWPPAAVGLVAIKDENLLELYARPEGGEWTFIHRYPVLAASGGGGPKLRRGDKQVPEGVYAITFLNPNSRYHVSLRVSYPNAFDRKMAAKDRRKDLGGDIMIHGKNSSAGCLAMGDEVAEELFVLAADVGKRNIKLIIAPTDFRKKEIPAVKPGQPGWLPDLYTEVSSAMSEFKAPPEVSLLTLLGL